MNEHDTVNKIRHWHRQDGLVRGLKHMKTQQKKTKGISKLLHTALLLFGAVQMCPKIYKEPKPYLLISPISRQHNPNVEQVIPTSYL